MLATTSLQGVESLPLLMQHSSKSPGSFERRPSCSLWKPCRFKTSIPVLGVREGCSRTHLGSGRKSRSEWGELGTQLTSCMTMFNPGALFTQQSVLASALEVFKDPQLRERYKNVKSSKLLMKSFYITLSLYN